MKKFYFLLLSLGAVLSMTAENPQLPNNGFEDGWGACTPWTSNGNTKTEGTTPADWTISQVIGISELNKLGATTVGEKAEGYESASAVKVINSPNSTIPSQTVPGYVTLGTTWSTSVMGNNNDGGTFGGISFTGRPEKITFMYKFTRGGDNAEPANAIAYLWKGTYTQADVPGNIVAFGKPTTCNMVNRDRNILGIETAQGGDITKTEGAELIAKGTTVISEVSEEWVKGEIVFEYLTESTPEMINVIFASNDYFGDPSKLVQGNALVVDNVQCIYSEKYSGKLVIKIGETLLTDEKGDDATISITPSGDSTCDFLLPNLTIASLENANLGDIHLEDVKMEKQTDGSVNYSGHNPHLILNKGTDSQIDADVTLKGTVDKERNASMDIDVIWNGLTIKCSFISTSGTTGISDVIADGDEAAVEYYNIQGVRVSGDALAPGLYIRRQGTKTSKVVIR